MPNFTSWDINLFLCLLSIGFPLDIVKDIVRLTKGIHEKHIEDETREWYCSRDSYKIYSKKWHRPNDTIRELKLAWRWRCPEIRRDLIYRMIMFENIRDIERLKYDFDPMNGRYRIDSDKDRPLPGRLHSSKGLWDLWWRWGGDNPVISLNKRQYTANWYKNIHEGRYFLFFNENCLTGYGRRKKKDIKISEKVKRFGSIHSIGPYEQMSEDLLVIDGPGLGKSGSKIEHIDDIFS